MGAAPPVKRERRGMPQWQLETPKALKRGLGSPALFGIVQGFIAASIYFALGLVIQAALGFAWLVFLVSAAFFGLLILSYVEGASLHQERGGATVDRPLRVQRAVSFIAGWAILLDYILLIAITAFATTDYARGRVRPGCRAGAPEFLLRRRGRRRGGVAATSAAPARKRYERFAYVVLADLVAADRDRGPRPGARVQPRRAHATRRASAARRRLKDLIFAFTLTLVTFAGVDASSGLAGEVAVGRKGLKRLMTARMLAFIPYVGISLVASARCRSTTCAAAARTTTSTRRCSASRPPSTQPWLARHRCAC